MVFYFFLKLCNIQVLSYFEKQSRLSVSLIGLTFVVFVGVIDYLTGYEIELAIFYLIPIAFVTWFAGKRSGALMSVVSAIVIFLADMFAGKIFFHIPSSAFGTHWAHSGYSLSSS